MKWAELAVKVKKYKTNSNVGKATKLLHEASGWPSSGIRVDHLLTYFDGNLKALNQWLEGITQMCFYSERCDNMPGLYQGDIDEDEFEGQPVVWDGGFGFDEETGKLMYIGAYGPSGWGGAAERVVKMHDCIQWESCEPLEEYVK